MRMPFTTQAEAQAYTDAIHQRLLVSDQDYAESVKAGETVRWAVPYQDLDEAGVPLTSTWYVNLKARVLPVVRDAERSTLVEYRRR